jgi:hypothetical protein
MREPDVIARDCRDGKDVDIWCPYTSLVPVVRALTDDGWLVVSGRSLGKLGSARHSTTLRFGRRRHGAWEKPVLEIFFGALRLHSVIYLPPEVVEASIDFEAGAPYLVGAARLAILITRTALRDTLSGERLERARRAFGSSNHEQRRLWFASIWERCTLR